MKQHINLLSVISLFLCLAAISLRRHCQKNIAKRGGGGGGGGGGGRQRGGLSAEGRVQTFCRIGDNYN